MLLNFNAALAEADVEAACRRAGIDDVRASILVDDYRSNGVRLLAASVLTYAMLPPGEHAEDRDRRAADCGADHYIRFLRAAGFGYPVPDDSHDWKSSIFRACCPTAGRPALSPEDRAYALGRFVAEGWRAVAAWVELAFLPPEGTAEVPVGVAVRVGCRLYLESRLWLRDHRPEGLPLSIYAAAG